LNNQGMGRGSFVRSTGWWIGAFVAGMTTMACGSDNGDGNGGADGCVPGRSVACTTTEGCDGAQECNDDHTYDACVCGAEPSTGGTSSGGGSGDGGSGNGSSASGGDGTGATSSGQGGTGNSGTGTGGISDENCAPVSMSSWTAPDYVPAKATPGACTAAQIQRYHDDCLMGTDCSAFEAGGDDEACGDCMRPSPLTDSSWGPVLEVAPRPFYRWENNTAGCHELLRASNRDCAEKIQAAQNCARDACVEVCNVTGSAYNACVIDARTAVCESYTTDAVCITTQEDLDACSGSGFEQIVLAQGLVFCG
jgi:hypothetical protein